MSPYRDYDPKDPWKVGDRLEYVSADEQDIDLRELDGMHATVLEIDDDEILVEGEWGRRWDDPWSFVQYSAPVRHPSAGEGEQS